MTWKHNISMKSIALIILFTLLAMKVTDLALLKYLPQSEYLFPPNSKALYKTREFDALASINRFGFRGNETEITEGQILVIGDSFTFGWGLKDDEVWARLLENSLKSSGLDLKVYNLGVPGTDTSFHLEVAGTYVRQLKPKFVVISVLMGDDFAQVLMKRLAEQSTLRQRAGSPSLPYWRTTYEFAKSNSIELFPGLYRFYAEARYFNFRSRIKPGGSGRSIDDQAVFFVTQSWAEESSRIVRDKKLSLPDDILERAAAGDVNPALLSAAASAARSAAAHPTREVLEKVKSAWRDLLVDMTRKFSGISSLTRNFGGRLIVFSMPNGQFVNSEVTKNYRKYGSKVTEDNLVTYKHETMLEQIAKSSDALFIPSLAEFRGYRGGELFFPFDGHPTPEGSGLLANIIAKTLVSQTSIR